VVGEEGGVRGRVPLTTLAPRPAQTTIAASPQHHQPTKTDWLGSRSGGTGRVEGGAHTGTCVMGHSPREGVGVWVRVGVGARVVCVGELNGDAACRPQSP
jgi:hypothetical protein